MRAASVTLSRDEDGLPWPQRCEGDGIAAPGGGRRCRVRHIGELVLGVESLGVFGRGRGAATAAGALRDARLALHDGELDGLLSGRILGRSQDAATSWSVGLSGSAAAVPTASSMCGNTSPQAVAAALKAATPFGVRVQTFLARAPCVSLWVST